MMSKVKSFVRSKQAGLVCRTNRYSLAAPRHQPSSARDKVGLPYTCPPMSLEYRPSDPSVLADPFRCTGDCGMRIRRIGVASLRAWS